MGLGLRGQIDYSVFMNECSIRLLHRNILYGNEKNNNKNTSMSGEVSRTTTSRQYVTCRAMFKHIHTYKHNYITYI